MISDEIILISIMFANNEIGTIEPIKEIGEIAKKHDVIFHTDAVQAFGKIPINVDEMNIDLLSASAHRFFLQKHSTKERRRYMGRLLLSSFAKYLLRRRSLQLFQKILSQQCLLLHEYPYSLFQ